MPRPLLDQTNTIVIQIIVVIDLFIDEPVELDFYDDAILVSLERDALAILADDFGFWFRGLKDGV